MIRIRNESNMQIIIGKAGQVSLWVIIAIAIVAIVGLLALLRQKPLPEIDNIGYFETCINQHPSLLAEIKEEIYNNSINKIENCFVDSTEELKKKNIKVESGETNLKIDLAPQRIKVSINKKMTLSSKEGTKNIEDFNFEIRHPLYELALVANEIASQEAKYCYFEYVGYMILYPEFDIKKTALSDSTKIYTILHKDSNSEMNIAIRSCAIPPGI